MITYPNITTILTTCVFVAAFLLYLTPSLTTLDVATVTDFLQFQPYEPTTLFVENARLCKAGEPGTAVRNIEMGGGICPVPLSESFTGGIQLNDKFRVTIAELSEKQAFISIVPLSQTPLQADALPLLTGSVFVNLAEPFFDSSHVFTLAMRIRMLQLGGTGVSTGKMRGLQMIDGTVTPLTPAILGHEIVRGSPLKLSMGDMIAFNATAPDADFGNLQVRIGSAAGIKVGARLPTRGQLVQSFAGGGTTVAVTWYERIQAEPAVLGIAAAFTVATSLIGRIAPLWKRKSKVRGRRRRQ